MRTIKMTAVVHSSAKAALFKRGAELGAVTEFLDCAMVAKTIGVSRSTVYNWRRSGLLPLPVRLGPNRVAYRRGDIDLWAAGRTTASPLKGAVA